MNGNGWQKAGLFIVGAIVSALILKGFSAFGQNPDQIKEMAEQGKAVVQNKSTIVGLAQRLGSLESERTRILERMSHLATKDDVGELARRVEALNDWLRDQRRSYTSPPEAFPRPHAYGGNQ